MQVRTGSRDCRRSEQNTVFEKRAEPRLRSRSGPAYRAILPVLWRDPYFSCPDPVIRNTNGSLGRGIGPQLDWRGLGGLSSIDATVKAKTEVTVQLTEKQRRERARQMILEAFRERTPLTVEGEYKVIAGRDIATDVSEQANGEAPEEREG